MTLSFVSGTEVGGKKSKARKEKRKEKKTQRKEKRKEKRKERGSKVAKIALAPARVAFLAVVSLNLFKIADKFKQGLQKDPGKVKAFWKKFKGDEKKFLAAIDKGAKVKAPAGSAAGIGAVSAAAAIATATPILIAAVSLLKELKIPSDEVEGGIDFGKEYLLDDEETDLDYTDEYLPPDKVGVSKGSATAKKDKPGTKELMKTDPDSETDEETDGKNKNLLLWGGAAAALLLLLK